MAVYIVRALNDTVTTVDTIDIDGPYVPRGATGAKGATGPIGLTGPGATFTTAPIRIYPVGTVLPVYVNNAAAFPPLSYVIITDGLYSITGQETTRTIGQTIISSPILAQPVIPPTNPNLLSVRVNTINNGIVGLSIAQGAAVTFSGPPGPAGVTQVGDLGTVIFYDYPLMNPPIQFVSGAQPLSPSVLMTATFILPNNLPIQYRVVAEFTGNIVTNQTLNSNIAYIGLTSTAAVNATNMAATFAGYNESVYGPMAYPIILLPNIVADGAATVNNPYSTFSDNNILVKFVGTFSAGMEIDFSLVAASLQPISVLQGVSTSYTFWVSGDLTVTCYPYYPLNY